MSLAVYILKGKDKELYYSYHNKDKVYYCDYYSVTMFNSIEDAQRILDVLPVEVNLEIFNIIEEDYNE